MIGQRLMQMRQARGLSLEALAEAAGGVVTKQSLSKYERGSAAPSPEVAERLSAVLRVKVSHLRSSPPFSVEILAYRKGSRLIRREQRRIESLTRHLVEQRICLQDLLGLWQPTRLPVQGKAVETLAAAEELAGQIRLSWNLGGGPVPSMTKLLEDHGVHVLEVDADERFDGLSAVVHDRRRQASQAAVAVRKGVSGDRQRLSLAHELAHLMGCASEAAAFRAGAALLVPAEAVRREIGTSGEVIRPAELLLFKRRWGMSVQATLHRLRDLGIIRETCYRRWCIRATQLGWRKREPLPMPAERGAFLRQCVQRALSANLLTRDEAEEMGEGDVETTPLLSLFGWS
jgi:Zn-dependent peptidase ImmA (M78 family)/transcriptional regulator with XRE-family HTH domain